ncbi:GntR family transcriptional regulator [Streptomyces lydicus]|uniref:GntR family transcriptional regulator n=1 Tax=Streptomyces lydicus TaxID=47763 RepID=UPI0037B590C8
MPIAEVGRRITQRIASGAYAPGTRLSAHKVAADLQLPLDSVKLALRDLAGNRTIEVQPTGRMRIPGPSNDWPHQLALFVKELAAAGVYPPGSVLPDRAELARALVTSKVPLAEALERLVEDGTLEAAPRRRLRVRRTATSAGPSPCPWPEPAATAADVDLTPASIQQVAREAVAGWSTRLPPTPSQLDRCIAYLTAAGDHLAKRARTTPNTEVEYADVKRLIIRMRVTAATVKQPSIDLTLWRTACLATSVLDLRSIVVQNEAGGITA